MWASTTEDPLSRARERWRAFSVCASTGAASGWCNDPSRVAAPGLCSTTVAIACGSVPPAPLSAGTYRRCRRSTRESCTRGEATHDHQTGGRVVKTLARTSALVAAGPPRRRSVPNLCCGLPPGIDLPSTCASLTSLPAPSAPPPAEKKPPASSCNTSKVLAVHILRTRKVIKFKPRLWCDDKVAKRNTDPSQDRTGISTSHRPHTRTKCPTLTRTGSHCYAIPSAHRARRHFKLAPPAEFGAI